MDYEQNLPTFYGDYIIRGTIGQGGMKVVALAYHAPTETDVALALLTIAQAEEEVRVRFQREIQLLNRLQHPNIIKILDSGSLDGFDYFAMPYLDGESLSDRLQRAPTPVPEARSIMTALCDAVHYAHAHGIIHRDLKPENILLLGDEPVLIDFGLSRDLRDAAGLTRDGQGLGTRGYVAPEQVLGGPGTVSAACDVYSLGAVFLEMLIGRWNFSRLFGNRFSFECIGKQPDCLQEQSLRVPQSLLEVCRTAMARDPMARYQTVADLSAAIQHACDQLDALINGSATIKPVSRKSESTPSPATSGSYPTALSNGPRVGQVISGRYTLVSQIGRGGMGEVWKATARNRPNAVAIKFLPCEVWNPTDLKQLRQRFELVVNLSHTNICTVNDLDVDPVAGVFLVMRYINGITLAQFCERQKAKGTHFTINEVCQLLQPVAAALDYAHSVGVVHRDIKLENVMLSMPNLQALIVDFELAEQIRTTMTRQIPNYQPIGTLAYLSPEAWQGKNTNPESDQYALGLIAYEMLSGDLPFGRKSNPEVLRQCTLLETVPFVSTIGPANQVLMQVLSKDPSRRFASCGEFIAALRRAADPQPQSIDHVVKPQPIPANKLLTPVTALLSVLLLAALVTALVTANFESSNIWDRLREVVFNTKHDKTDPTLPTELASATDEQFWLGCKQIQTREFDAAVTTLTQVLVNDPEHLDALLFRGLAYRHLQQLEQALGDFDRALSIAPTYVAALVDRAETVRLMGVNAQGQSNSQATNYFSRSVTEFSNALAIEPDAADAWLGRARAKVGMKLFAEAIEDLSRSIEINPNSADAFEERGNAYVKLQNDDGAYQDFVRAIALDPNRTHLDPMIASRQKQARAR